MPENVLDEGGNYSVFNGMFLRRLGPATHATVAQCAGLSGCPDILELASGDFAVIGEDITETARANMLPTAGCGPEERVVRIPRQTLVLAKAYIPERA